MATGSNESTIETGEDATEEDMLNNIDAEIYLANQTYERNRRWTERKNMFLEVLNVVVSFMVVLAALSLIYIALRISSI